MPTVDAAAGGNPSHDRVASMNERRTLPGGSNDVSWHPEDIDHAPRQHLGGGTVDADLSRLNPSDNSASVVAVVQ
jgi:hypothetical protein